MHKNRSTALAVRFAILVAAILSLGSSCSGSVSFQPPPPVVPSSPTGIWIGLITTASTSSTDDSDCLIAETFEIVCFFTDPVNGQFLGGLQAMVSVVNGNQVNGSGRIYAAPGQVLPDGISTVLDFTITNGVVVEGVSIRLDISAGGIPSTITGAFDSSYLRASSLGIVAGSYTSFDIFGDTSSFVIDSVGALSAQTMTGCTVNGIVSIIDPQFNAYDVNMTLTGCVGGLNGVYDGLASTADFVGTNDTFLFAAFNQTSMIAGVATK